MSAAGLLTIGFTQKSAEEFFTLLAESDVTILADVRLNTKGQLSGFAKARDIEYFLGFFGIKYEYWSDFAPTKEMRKNYHAERNFENYAHNYKELIESRNSVEILDSQKLHSERICLMCSEPTCEKCHRLVAAMQIITKYPELDVEHI